MTENNEISVEYRLSSPDVHTLKSGAPALPDLKIDYEGIPQDQRGGTAVRLLCSSCLYCFASTMATALINRKVQFKSFSGKATAIVDKDSVARHRVLEIKIKLEVDVEEKDIPLFEKWRSITMERGCLITYSLEDAIDIKYEINRTGEQ